MNGSEASRAQERRGGYGTTCPGRTTTWWTTFLTPAVNDPEVGLSLPGVNTRLVLGELVPPDVQEVIEGTHADGVYDDRIGREGVESDVQRAGQVMDLRRGDLVGGHVASIAVERLPRVEIPANPVQPGMRMTPERLLYPQYVLAGAHDPG